MSSLGSLISLLTLALFVAACASDYADPSREFAPAFDRSRTHADQVKAPDPIGVWDAPLTDDPDVPKRAACITCHGPVPKVVPGAKPGELFHTDVEIDHGNLTCNQCHDADRTRLHLADGTTLDFSETMRMCAQCHGPQYTDYQHGAHGGMTGYWDTTQGARQRNNCLDCHAAHDPDFEAVMPVFPPRDRYFGGH